MSEEHQRDTKNTTNHQVGEEDAQKPSNTIVFDWGDLNADVPEPNTEGQGMEDDNGGEEYGEEEIGEEGENEIEAPQIDVNAGCSIKLDFGLDDLLQQALNNPQGEPAQPGEIQEQQNQGVDQPILLSAIPEEPNEESSKKIQNADQDVVEKDQQIQEDQTIQDPQVKQEPPQPAPMGVNIKIEGLDLEFNDQDHQIIEQSEPNQIELNEEDNQDQDNNQLNQEDLNNQQNQMNFNQIVEPQPVNNNIISFDNMDFMDLDQPMEEEKQPPQNLTAHPNQQSTEPITFEQIEQNKTTFPAEGQQILENDLNIKINSGLDEQNIEPNNSIKIDFETGLANQDDFNMKVVMAQDEQVNPDPLQKPKIGESIQIGTETQQPVPEVKKSSKKSNRENRLITDIYNLKKVKYTLDFGPQLSSKILKTAQFIYTLEMKDKEEVLSLIEKWKKDEVTKVNFKLGLHLKQFQIQEIWMLKKGDAGGRFQKHGEPLKIPRESKLYGEEPKSKKSMSWYVSPQMQAIAFESTATEHMREKYGNKDITPKIPIELNLFDQIQKDTCYWGEQESKIWLKDQEDKSQFESYRKKPELFMTLFDQKLKDQTAEELYQQIFEKNGRKLKFLVTVGQTKDGKGQAESITNFGIKSVDYMLEEQKYSSLSSKKDRLATYMVTSDSYEASQSWIPQIFGTTRQPINWTMNYLVPQNCTMVSSGKFLKRQDYPAHNVSMYIFKSKSQKVEAQDEDEFQVPNSKFDTKGKIIPDNIGFLIGNLPFMSMVVKEKPDQSIHHIGTALFTSHQKQMLFDDRGFYSGQVQAIVAEIGKMLRFEHPCNAEGDDNQKLLKLVFVPNLFRRKSLKQSLDFADGIHVFDEEVLLPRNVIEKRHKIYKILGTSLAFDWLGAMIWEKSIEDTWLLCGMRERIGDRYRRKKTGVSMYKYQIMKTMRKYTDAIEQNSERFSLASKYLPHFSELTYGEDLWYMKCQLVMHIVEQVLQETHYINVSRVLLKNANPTMSVAMFKDQLKNCGIKDDNIKKNWIESTSCVQIECSYEFIKKSNSVKINLVQKSLVKNHMLFCDHLKYNEKSKHLINPRGDQILDRIENMEDLSNQEPRSEEERKKEREDKIKQDLDSNYYFDKKRQAKRWFLGDINVAIYQTDGAEIQCQNQKIKLKHAKSNVEQSINLNCKVRKAHGRKKDEGFDEIGDGFNDGQQRSSMALDPNTDIFDNSLQIGPKIPGQRGSAQDPVKAKAEQYLQQYKDNSQWKFGFLFDYEFKEYPERGTKSLFQRKNTDSPILWIRIDPDCEYIRRVKIVNPNLEAQKESWLFQLLQDRDDLSQYEACYELRNFNDEFVFEILKSVAQNEKYFIKVRKQALKSLEFIQESAFREVLTYEQLFLVKQYNYRNYNEKIGFYKSNDFKNILEYYFNTYLIRSLAKSKENKLKLRDDIIKFKNDQASKMKENRMVVESKFGQGTVKFGVQDEDDDNEMSENQDSQNAEDEQKKREQYIDLSNFSITTQTISDLILRVLRENENSENAFDDSFFIGKILSNLGKLDNFQVMPDIAQEVLKHLNLDLTGKFSPQYAISKGAIKSTFNLRKQIWIFRNIKKQYLVDTSKPLEAQFDDNEEIKIFELGILQTEKILAQLDQQFELILRDPCWPFELRTFIFQKKVKSMFLYQQEVIDPLGIPQSVLMPLQTLLGQILSNVNDCQYQFAATQLEILAKFLEKNFLKKLNFKETLVDSEICSKVSKYLSHLIVSHPICLIDRQIVVWAKRIFNTVFMGSGIPLFLKSRIDYQSYRDTFEQDEYWFQVENFQQQKDAQNYKQTNPNLQNVQNFSTGIDKITGHSNNLQAPLSNIISIDQSLVAQNQFANNPLLNFTIPQPILGSQQQQNVDIQALLANANSAQGIQTLSPHKDLKSNQITIDILGAQANQAHQNPNPSSSQPIVSFQSQDQVMQDANALQQPLGNSLQINFDELLQSKYDDFQIAPPKPDKKSKKKSKAKNKEEVMNFPSTFQGQDIQQDQQKEAGSEDNDEYQVAVQDDFPDYKFEEPWRQKCWDVLYMCFFHSEAEPFLEALDSAEYLISTYGEDFFNQYIQSIDNPMTLPMIKTKCIQKIYQFPDEFEQDMLLVFKNAMSFNKRGTGVYKAAANLKRFFQKHNNYL